MYRKDGQIEIGSSIWMTSLCDWVLLRMDHCAYMSSQSFFNILCSSDPHLARQGAWKKEVKCNENEWNTAKGMNDWEIIQALFGAGATEEVSVTQSLMSAFEISQIQDRKA